MDNILKMSSMELPDKQKTKDIDSCMATQVNKFPYGLLLRLENEQISVLPDTGDLDVGDKVIVHAECSVVSKRLNEQTNKDEEKSMEIQIEKMSIMKKLKKLDEMDYEEYRITRRKK